LYKAYNINLILALLDCVARYKFTYVCTVCMHGNIIVEVNYFQTVAVQYIMLFRRHIAVNVNSELYAE